MHGEKCGIGAIIITKLKGQNLKKIIKTLKDVKAPTTAKQIGLTEDQVSDALMIAQDLRPERYTIFKDINKTELISNNIAKSCNVI